MIKRVVLLILLLIALVSGVWAVFHFKKLKQLSASVTDIPPVANVSTFDSWTSAVEKVKADRTDPMGPVETPPELRHYSDRHWFLATQVAEIKKNNVPICQDYLDLAAMIERGEMVSVPGVTETYVLYGVAQRVDEGSFTNDEDESVTEYVESLDEHDLERLSRYAQAWAAAVWQQMVPLSEAEKETTLASLKLQ